ncbi:class I SAM-dependent methyltransferase [Rhodococcus rhodnii]|uniref:SAM-dependent methyltransferase n=2 Tax=Rhodococcus rhodnii TaxID=38312 RepID=R7WLN0_9NOCA|nr:class I SAM-dependent methyltransferase [Rhodococcus rhodnii]EOM76195.1 SAM-dependent methyltransferase [Rhodococcus rhodnii LMG 5362]TXG91828.1 class I SAM-dependent methyltransferase [Rhodococcus rhodnii]
MAQTRWEAERSQDDSQRYVERFDELADAGEDLHGEARFVDALLPRDSAVLDAGCGTGRVGSELARRSHAVTAVDLDDVLLARARQDPSLDVRRAELATLDLGCTFDAVVAAGNVMVFLEPGSERRVVGRVRAHLDAGGLFVAGFTSSARYTPERFDDDLAAEGFAVVHRFGGWAMEPWAPGSDWRVTVARAE